MYRKREPLGGMRRGYVISIARFVERLILENLVGRPLGVSCFPDGHVDGLQAVLPETLKAILV